MYIVLPKAFPWRKAKGDDDIISLGNYVLISKKSSWYLRFVGYFAVLGFLFLPWCQKTTKNDSKLIKINEMPKRPNSVGIPAWLKDIFCSLDTCITRKRIKFGKPWLSNTLAMKKTFWVQWYATKMFPNKFLMKFQYLKKS